MQRFLSAAVVPLGVLELRQGWWWQESHRFLVLVGMLAAELAQKLLLVEATWLAAAAVLENQVLQLVAQVFLVVTAATL
jgi:hypothetical protein